MDNMMDDSPHVATAKVTIAWIGMLIGGVTLSNIALLLTIVFTALQIFKLIRQELRDRKKAREDSAAFAAKIKAPETP